MGKASGGMPGKDTVTVAAVLLSRGDPHPLLGAAQQPLAAALRGVPRSQAGQAPLMRKETTVPPKRLGPECQDSAMEATRNRPRP
ncbi:hypothetical protein GCM10023336_19190 [Streptomyces similanensis]|uniref:Uncharacterized protein n=1 Tax=Streptomyces similanensis TaxID=1274988 RepID=A0ABP9K6H3_9ACTN